MPIRITNLRLGLDEPETELPIQIARILGVSLGTLQEWRILRKSLDTRDQEALRFVYTVEAALGEEEVRLAQGAPARSRQGVRIEPYREPPFTMPPPGQRPLAHRPVVIGSGPAGLVGAYLLAEQGYCPLVLERGRAVRDRIH